MNWKAGSLAINERELDFALTTPKQYFNVLMPKDGEQTVYTRQGAFYVSPVEDGQLMLVTMKAIRLQIQQVCQSRFPMMFRIIR